MELKSRFNPKLFLPSMSSLLLLGAMAVALQGVAFAHYPIVASATPSCSNGQIVINFTINSWDIGSTGVTGSLGPHDGENGLVQVFFNEDPTSVASGVFADPVDSFSGTAAAPLGVTSVHVSAVAQDTWGDGEAGGQSSDVFFTSMDVDLTTVGTCTPPTGIGRFTGGGKVVVSNAIVPAGGSVTVTKGFEVDCDRMPTHENLELNWNTGDHFHMNQITFTSCTLQGNPPNPPKAPVNRIDGAGTGSYDGTPGYTVLFTLWDQGEPGTNDQAGFIVCQSTSATSCTGTVVLSVPLQLVSTGNIQAHVDQK